MMCIVLAGGDLRMGYGALALEKEGQKVCFWCGAEGTALLCPHCSCLSSEQTPDGQILVLPFPLSKDQQFLAGAEGKLALRRVEAVLPRFRAVVGGTLPPSLFQTAQKADVLVVDLSQEEAYTMALAEITAEATLALLFAHTHTMTSHHHIGILGYGRMGQSLVKRILALGGRVTVFARSTEKQTLARINGASRAEGFPPSSAALVDLSVLVNTVPQATLTPDDLKALPQDALLVELATGSHFPTATGHKLVLGHGLPGKILPRAAGEALAHIILQKVPPPSSP